MVHFCVDVVFGLLVVIFFRWVGFWGDWECVVEHGCGWCFLLFCTCGHAGCMCVACCKDILLQHICAGQDGWRSMG